MSPSGDISLSDTGCPPPVNPNCPICHNLDATVHGRQGGLKIRIHDNEEFRRSAAESCLGCRVVRDGVINMAGSTEAFPEVILSTQNNTENTLETGKATSGTGLFAELHCQISGSWDANMPHPLWYSGSSRLELRFYTLPGELSIWNVIPELPEPSLDSTSDEALRTVKSWLDNCFSQHSNCVQLSTRLPTRVLFVGEEHPRLVAPEGEYGAYVALSWRWGVEEPLKTTKRNLERHLQVIPWHDLPSLFRDAATVTRKLGLQYLWIDALCIVQDSAEDWAAEASKMTEVYGNAHFTIAADACDNAFHGLSGDERQGTRAGHSQSGNGRLRNLLRSEFQTPCPSRSGPGTTNVRVRTLAYRTAQGCHGRGFLPPSTLETRGWCLQESLLSPRVLHFGPTEISWQCREVTCCECTQHSGSSIPAKLYKFDHFSNLNHLFLGKGDGEQRLWRRIVEAFSRRHLSRDTDRLPAIEGVARAIMARDNLPETSYLAGLWRSRICYELVWYVRDDPVQGRDPTARWKSRRMDGVPTWSWASITGPVNFKLLEDEDIEFRVQEIATPPAAEPFVVLRGRLWKQGIRLTTQELQDDTSAPGDGSLVRRVYIVGQNWKRKLYTDHWDYRPDSKGVPSELCALRVTRFWWLILERYREAPHVRGLAQFKRIGMSYLKDLPESEAEDQSLALF